MLAHGTISRLFSSQKPLPQRRKVRLAYHGLPTTNQCIRISDEAKAHWQELADKHTGGNLTAMLHAAMATFNEKKNVIVVTSLKEAAEVKNRA